MENNDESTTYFSGMYSLIIDENYFNFCFLVNTTSKLKRALLVIAGIMLMADLICALIVLAKTRDNQKEIIEIINKEFVKSEIFIRKHEKFRIVLGFLMAFYTLRTMFLICGLIPRNRVDIIEKINSFNIRNQKMKIMKTFLKYIEYLFLLSFCIMTFAVVVCKGRLYFYMIWLLFVIPKSYAIYKIMVERKSFISFLHYIILAARKRQSNDGIALQNRVGSNRETNNN